MSADPVVEELGTLVPGLRQLEEPALTRLYELTADMLVSIAVGMLHDVHAAEDVVQDVFVRFVHHVGALDKDTGYAVRAWLVTATRNRCLDILRSGAHRREDATEELPDTPTPAPTLPDPELLEALDTLTDDQREALLLRHVAGMSGAEIGDVMGRNRAAVYALVRRAERSLRTALDDPVRSDPARSSPT